MGVRAGSRPRPRPGTFFSNGSCTARAESARRACRSHRRSRASACPAESGAASRPRAPAPRRRGSRCAACRDCRAPSSASRRPAAPPRTRSISVSDASRLPRQPDQLKVERQVHAVAARAVVGHEPLDRQIDLADQHPIVVLVDQPRASPRRSRACRGDRRCRAAAARGTAAGRGANPDSAGCRGTRSSLMRWHIDIDAEAVDAAVEPEAQHVMHGAAALPGCAS